MKAVSLKAHNFNKSQVCHALREETAFFRRRHLHLAQVQVRISCNPSRDSSPATKARSE
jgi:hypothetical protein